MFNQKNKVTRADYEQWRAGQDETAARIASDPDRLLFHVEPELGWLNDPNGLVQIGDTYHIYHQYDPFDAAHGGPVLWNHLTTKDFVTYENHGPVLFPDSNLDSSERILVLPLYVMARFTTSIPATLSILTVMITTTC